MKKNKNYQVIFASVYYNAIKKLYSRFVIYFINYFKHQFYVRVQRYTLIPS